MTAAKITFDDVQRFTYGSCYQLAQAIRDVTGWPVYAFWDDHFNDYDIHAFVKTPSGTFLDVLGEHTRYQMLTKWDGRHIRRVANSYDMHTWDQGNPFYDSSPRAKEIAPVLVAGYHSKREGIAA